MYIFNIENYSIENSIGRLSHYFLKPPDALTYSIIGAHCGILINLFFLFLFSHPDYSQNPMIAYSLLWGKI